MFLKKGKTSRGFFLIEFQDRYGTECTIQKSSLVEENAIWFGVDNPKPQILASKTPEGGTGWVSYPLPDDVHIFTRMHLTQKQVKKLIPILQHFVETGELK